MTDQQDTETSTTKLSISQSEKGEEEQRVEEQGPPQPSHPRSHFPAWKWKGTLVLIFLACVLNGTSNPLFFSPSHVTLGF